MPDKSDSIKEKYVKKGKFCISFDFLNDIWDKEFALMKWRIESYFSAIKRSIVKGTTAK